MKLTELNPIWISLGGSHRKSAFTFDCPHCRKVRLVCKSLPASVSEQRRVLDLPDPSSWVSASADSIWGWSQDDDFPTMTVTPSIDASSSGHWHGHITNGEIRS